MAHDERITIFGTSPRFLVACEQAGIRPRREFELSALRTIISTGSPLNPPSYRYVYREVKPDVQLASITGGTDLMSCFGGGCPMQPVYEGELQARGLGMKTEVYDDAGQPLHGEQGELVCTAPFPSVPIGFWSDTGRRALSRDLLRALPERLAARRPRDASPRAAAWSCTAAPTPC